jgi:putative transposase
VHSELGVSPLKKLEQGVFGDGGQLPTGLRDIPQDETEIRLQLMPYELKTVQQYGIRWDYVNYYSDVLRPWINAKNPESDGRNGGKFIVRRDPRDISKVYFYDPELRQHFEIPYRNLSRPTMTLWEIKAARKRLVEQGVEDIDEDKIFRAHDELHEIAENAKRETKAARRRRQRKVESKKAKTVRLGPDSSNSQSDDALGQAESLDFDNIQPFDEIEELDERG